MNKKAVVLFTVLISTTLITLLSLSLFMYMVSQITLINHQIERAKAFYGAEAALVLNTERLRRNQTLDATTTIDWYYISGKMSPGKVVDVNYTSSGIGPYQTNPLNLTVDYYNP